MKLSQVGFCTLHSDYYKVQMQLQTCYTKPDFFVVSLFSPSNLTQSLSFLLSHFPLCSTVTIAPLEHEVCLSWHSVSYVTPSAPHTKASLNGPGQLMALDDTQCGLPCWSSTQHLSVPRQATLLHDSGEKARFIRVWVSISSYCQLLGFSSHVT